nr:MAG TPA: hypothetical protein [Caudoviricetes sp.]
MQNVGGNNFSLNQFEYCYLVEDTDPCARTMKIYVPKLMGQKNASNSTTNASIDQSSFINSQDSRLESSSNVQSANYIVARVQLPLAHRHKFHDCPGNCPNKVHDAQTCCPGTSTLKDCPHFHHDHHFPHLGDKGLMPKGTRLICMFMNDDPNDCIVTRLEVMFPDGTMNPGEPVNEHR